MRDLRVYHGLLMLLRHGSGKLLLGSGKLLLGLLELLEQVDSRGDAHGNSDESSSVTVKRKHSNSIVHLAFK